MATFNGPGIRVLKQYEGQDGKTYVQLDTGETLATDSSDYEDYYAQGILYGEDERGNYYPQEGAHDILKQYQSLTQNNSFENYMKPYFDDEITGSIARGLGQSMDKFWEVNPSYKQNYDNEIKQQLVNQFLGQNPAYDDGESTEARGTYLDRITRGLPEGLGEFIVNSGNAGVQPGYWSDFNRGAYSVGNEILPEWLGGGDSGLINSIRNDTSMTLGERNSKEHAIQTGQYGFADRSMDQLGLLAPLAVPAKIVQSAYMNDYQFDDAIAGRKNNASLAEDILTDPLTYTGLGIAENLAGKTLPKASEIAENINRFGAKNLPNAYQINPFAFRTNSNNFYRQIDEAGLREIEDAMGLIRGRGNEGAASYSKGELYYGGNQRPNILIESRNPSSAFNPVDDLISDSENVNLSNRPLDLLDNKVNTYERDWLQGYKKLDKPKTLEADLPGGMKMIRDKDETAILNPVEFTKPDGSTGIANESISLINYSKSGSKDPYYHFYADMPSSPLKAGKAYKMLDDFIPIGGKIQEPGSLSWDSFKNVLKQSQQDKFNAYQDGFIPMNGMSKDVDRQFSYFPNDGAEFQKYFDDLNKQLDELGFDKVQLKEEQVDPRFPAKLRAQFPNIVLEKKFEQGGMVLPDWLYE